MFQTCGRPALACAATGLAIALGGATAPALADILTGTTGRDHLTGQAGASEIRGLAGNDVLFGDPAAGVGAPAALRQLTGAAINPANTYYGLLFSPDGETLVFGGLIFDAAATPQELFSLRLFSGAARLISSDEAGQPSGLYNYAAAFSPDSRFVAFESWRAFASNDEDFQPDIYIKDLATGAIRLVSTNASGTKANDYSFNPSFSPDGTMVAFESAASNLVAGDTNGVVDVFVKTLATGAVRRLSVRQGAQGNGPSGSARFAPDGKSVAFTSEASNLVAGDTNGVTDLFVADLSSGAVQRLSTSGSGAQANAAVDAASVGFTPDGRGLVFASTASNLVPNDTNGVADVFLKTRSTGAIARVSTGAGGSQATGGDSRSPSVAPDGTKLVFVSEATNLVPGDTNGAPDVFLKDLVGGGIRRISSEPGGGQRATESSGPTFAPDGTAVAYLARTGDYDCDEEAPCPRADVFLVTLAPGPAGSDVIYAGSGDDRAFGAGGSDRLVGDVGFDRLQGGPGDDSLNGGDGEDDLVGGPGRDRVNGSAAFDRASFEDAPAAVTVSVDAAGNGAARGGDTDTLTSVESLLGSRFGDTLSNAVDFGRLEGGPGNDRLTGSAASVKGQRVVFDTAGHPVLVDLKQGFSRNRDGFPNTEGVDTLTNIRLIGGSPLPEGDVLIGNDLPNKIQGLAGPDVITGNRGADQILYFSVDDSPAFAPDVITDFRRAEGDRIHLLALGPLTFIGSAAFTAPRQIRAVTSVGTTTVEVNTAGTGGAEMALVLQNVTSFDPARDLVQP